MHSGELADRDLVTKAQAGDRDSFRCLVERYQRRVLALVNELVRNRDDAEDIAQEVFVRAYFSLQDFRGSSSFYTWLYRIAYNLTIDFKRKVASHGGEAAEFDELKSVSFGSESGLESPDQAVLRAEQRVEINRALGEISDEHRAVIVLREVDGLSYDEIARVTGVAKGTVMSRLHYARRYLQKALRHFSSKGDGAGGLGASESDTEQVPLKGTMAKMVAG